MDWQKLVIDVAVVVLTALGSWVLAKVKTLVNTKVKNEKARELLGAATSAVTSSVKATFQTYEDKKEVSNRMKDAWAESNGNIMQSQYRCSYAEVSC